MNQHLLRLILAWLFTQIQYACMISLLTPSGTNISFMSWLLIHRRRALANDELNCIRAVYDDRLKALVSLIWTPFCKSTRSECVNTRVLKDLNGTLSPSCFLVDQMEFPYKIWVSSYRVVILRVYHDPWTCYFYVNRVQGWLRCTPSGCMLKSTHMS